MIITAITEMVLNLVRQGAGSQKVKNPWETEVSTGGQETLNRKDLKIECCSR